MRVSAVAAAAAAFGLGAAPAAAPALQDWEVRAPLRADRTGTFQDPRVAESSGVAASQARTGVLWTVNDSGNDAVLFATDTLGTALGAVVLAGASNVDWEDLALGPCGPATCLYVADTGDNGESRENVVVYRVPEPEAGAPGDPVPVEVLRIRYPDAPHDVEALFVDSLGNLHLVTKGREEAVLHFRVRGTAWGSLEPVAAEGMGSLPIAPGGSLADRVTGAALGPGGRVVVRSYRRLYFFRLRTDGRLEPLGAPPAACSVAGLEAQGEAVAWLDGRRLVLTSERFAGLAPGTIHVVECPIP